MQYIVKVQVLVDVPVGADSPDQAKWRACAAVHRDLVYPLAGYDRCISPSSVTEIAPKEKPNGEM
ncbi:hypothetical protein [Aggregatilinea lenta]|uniref:hypothetical protein n=1 Tax=Aggregatilinea lenta TaxID=913108 RepID=UPI000E5BA71A|nr:hypothetical protein [Aggregatilinea lenta]